MFRYIDTIIVELSQVSRSLNLSEPDKDLLNTFSPSLMRKTSMPSVKSFEEKAHHRYVLHKERLSTPNLLFLVALKSKSSPALIKLSRSDPGNKRLISS